MLDQPFQHAAVFRQGKRAFIPQQSEKLAVHSAVPFLLVIEQRQDKQGILGLGIFCGSQFIQQGVSAGHICFQQIKSPLQVHISIGSPPDHLEKTAALISNKHIV